MTALDSWVRPSNGLTFLKESQELLKAAALAFFLFVLAGATVRGHKLRNRTSLTATWVRKSLESVVRYLMS
jgi:hypothetical protein